MALNEKLNPRKNRKITKFGNPKITIGGKQRDLREMIHENAKDTGIYEQIDKYGLNPIQEISVEEAVMDFTSIAGDLRTSLEKGMAAKQQWGQLPKEIRKEFNNDINEFMQNGAQWMANKHKEIMAKTETAKATTEVKENINVA